MVLSRVRSVLFLCWRFASSAWSWASWACMLAKGSLFDIAACPMRSCLAWHLVMAGILAVCWWKWLISWLLGELLACSLWERGFLGVLTNLGRKIPLRDPTSSYVGGIFFKNSYCFNGSQQKMDWWAWYTSRRESMLYSRMFWGSTDTVGRASSNNLSGAYIRKSSTNGRIRKVMICSTLLIFLSIREVKSAQLIDIVSSSCQVVKLSRIRTLCQMYEFLRIWTYWNILKRF